MTKNIKQELNKKANCNFTMPYLVDIVAVIRIGQRGNFDYHGDVRAALVLDFSIPEIAVFAKLCFGTILQYR